MRFSLTLSLLFAPAAFSQPVGCHQVNLPPTATCVENADGITITLMGASRIGWKDFTIPAGATVKVVSQAGAVNGFSSLHVNEGATIAKVDGNLQADGPLSVVSTKSLTVGQTGRISAPSVFLSTHKMMDEVSFQQGNTTPMTAGSGAGLTVNGQIGATSGNVVALSHTVTVNNAAKITAPNGKVEITAARVGASGNHAGVTLVADPEDDGALQNTGDLSGREVLLVASGFIRNAGGITSSGGGNRVSLTAPSIVHENQPRSVITSSKLSTTGNSFLQGQVINPDDGANPGGVTTTRQIPNLSQNKITDQVLTRLEPTRLSYNQLQEIRTPALAKQANTGNTSLRQADTQTAKKNPPKSAAAATGTTVVRRGFFGTVQDAKPTKSN
jgi:hypothetical protein